MNLSGIKIEGLFSSFDYGIDFNLEDKITLLTAPNGYGKTVILKIIESALSLKLDYFINLSFRKIHLYFDGVSLTIRKDVDQISAFYIELNNDSATSFLYDTHLKSLIQNKVSTTELCRAIPALERLSDCECYDKSVQDIIDLDEAIERYPNVLTRFGINTSDFFPKWYLELVSSVSCHFIADQRLIQKEGAGRIVYKTLTDTIEKYAKELCSDLKRSRAEYALIAQSLDSQLPLRLLSPKNPITPFSSAEIFKKLNELRVKQKTLRHFNLLLDEVLLPEVSEAITEENARLLTLFLQDSEQKIAVFDSILRRTNLFLDLLNEKSLTLKRIEVNADDGLVIKDKNQKPIKLSQLSSGEQNQIILLFELIFKVRNQDIVLIDEPEISLHIAWQKDFLDDIQKIMTLLDIQVIIATHSPQIIDSRWDLAVDLEGDIE